MTKTILVSDRRVRLVLNTFNRFFCFSEPSTMSTRLYSRSEVDFNTVSSQNYMCKIISTFALTLGEGKSRMLTCQGT